MIFNHNTNISYGFDVSLECEGFTGGNKSETIIGIHPEEGCRFAIQRYGETIYEADEDDPVYLLFHGDCELKSLISNLQFLLEILKGYEGTGIVTKRGM